MARRRFYQTAPSLLVPAAVITIVILLIAIGTFYVAAWSAQQVVFEAGILVAAIAGGIPIVFARDLFRPMLTLDDTYLIYRRTVIPWSRVLEVCPTQVGAMNVMGIKIVDPDQPLLYLTKSTSVRNVLARKNDLLLAKNGALIVPAARGLSIPEMCERVNAFRKR